MSLPTRDELWARLGLSIGAWVPYWRFATLSVLFFADDKFTSDIWNGELAGLVLAGRMLANGDLSGWTHELCSGVAIGAPPLPALPFAFLPTAVALDLLVLALLQAAAHGGYTLARRQGATRTGAVVCGLAFAGSGYVAAQLKHLSIVSTVVWLPWCMCLLDRGLTDPDVRVRRVQRVLLAMLFSAMALCGFPQAVYICGLVLGSFALFRVLSPSAEVPLSARERGAGLLACSAALLFALLASAAVLWPIYELGRASGRVELNTYEWTTKLNYYPGNAWTFLVPYINGDVSDGSYKLPSLFWEDYGYIGAAPFLLAVYAMLTGLRSRSIRYFAALGIFAYLIVLGSATPVFRWAFELVPGMSLFRFPTRFLIVVELALAVLAALGLSQLQRMLVARASAPLARYVPWLGVAVCVSVVLDLSAHQPRQNPIVDAADWLAPPRSVLRMRASGEPLRVFTPFHTQFHRGAHAQAQGYRDLSPYFALRELVEPNSGVYWNVPTANCYAAIAPKGQLQVWGDVQRGITGLAVQGVHGDMRAGSLRAPDSFGRTMRTYGVTHVISPLTIDALGLGPGLGDEHAHAAEPSVHIYPVPGSRRVRLVAEAKLASDDKQARALLSASDFDPERTVILHDDGNLKADAAAWVLPPSAAVLTPSAAGSSSAEIVEEHADSVVVRVRAPHDGWLVLGDSHHPGWQAAVDGRAASVMRANLSLRAVRVAAGDHSVRFVYDSPTLRAGYWTSGVAWLVLLGLLAYCTHARRRAHAQGS